MGLSVLIDLNLPLSTPLPRHSAHSAESMRDRFLHHRGLLSGGLIDHCIHRWCLLAIERRGWLHSFLFTSSFGALWGCLLVGLYTVWGVHIDRGLSGVTLAAVNSSRRRRVLVPDAVRSVSVRCGGLDWTCRQRARGSPDVFLTPPTGGLQNIASVVHEPRNRWTWGKQNESWRSQISSTNF